MPALRPKPERLLLALLGSIDQPAPETLGRLDAVDWSRLGAIARIHRLGPQLHALHRENSGIPASLRKDWRDAYRLAALTALAQRSDLEECCALLEANGFRPVALKGAFLSRHAWPDPAQRPMRDIDLLLPQDQVLDAFRLLRAQGCAQPEPSKLALDDHVRLEQHMPVLVLPRGSWLELHMRVSELDGRLEYATPAGNEAALIDRAITLDGIRFPCPTDMLAHLVTHAIYGHRLDCGPLLLGDVRHLVDKHPLDWDGFWREARAQRWEPGAALVFELVRASHGAQAVPRHAAEPPVGADLLELARDLIVQDWQTKTYSRFAAAFATGGLGYVWRRMTGRVEGAGAAAVTIERHGEGGRLRWAWARAASMARQLADPEVRAQARQLARYRRWLEG